MKTIILDIETWSPDWQDGERGWEEESFAPTAYHEPVVIAWLIVDRQSKRVGSEIESEFSINLKSFRIDKSPEKGILLELKNDFSIANRLVTWNGRSFDMPVLSCRALALGIDWAWWHKWRHRFPTYKQELKHYDLLEQLGDYGAARGLRLDRVAKLCGLPGKQGMDGSQVHAMWATGDNKQRERIKEYCVSDVVNLWMIYLRFGTVFFGIPKHVIELAEQCTQEVVGHYLVEQAK